MGQQTQSSGSSLRLNTPSDLAAGRGPESLALHIWQTSRRLAAGRRKFLDIWFLWSPAWPRLPRGAGRRLGRSLGPGSLHCSLFCLQLLGSRRWRAAAGRLAKLESTAVDCIFHLLRPQRQLDQGLVLNAPPVSPLAAIEGHKVLAPSHLVGET